MRAPLRCARATGVREMLFVGIISRQVKGRSSTEKTRSENGFFDCTSEGEEKERAVGSGRISFL